MKIAWLDGWGRRGRTQESMTRRRSFQLIRLRTDKAQIQAAIRRAAMERRRVCTGVDVRYESGEPVLADGFAAVGRRDGRYTSATDIQEVGEPSASQEDCGREPLRILEDALHWRLLNRVIYRVMNGCYREDVYRHVHRWMQRLRMGEAANEADPCGMTNQYQAA